MASGFKVDISSLQVDETINHMRMKKTMFLDTLVVAKETYLKGTVDVAFNSDYIISNGLTGDHGFTVGYTVTKDMDTQSNDYLPADYAPYNVEVPSGIVDTSYWDDWGNDIFDDWGNFYIFDVASKKYFFPIFTEINLDDGVFATETFSAFNGRIFTIRHGYPAQGIYKFQISVNDNKEFIFGAYGDMGSDEDGENTNLTESYTFNEIPLTLYYNRNVEIGSSTERLFSYFIPYEVSANTSKTYTEFVWNEDVLGLYSKAVKKGINVYFSKKNDVKDWVINDLTNGGTVLTVKGNSNFIGNVLTSGYNIGRTNLILSISDDDYYVSTHNLINSYFTNSDLSSNRYFYLPTAASIVASLQHCVENTSFQFTINNVQSYNYSRILSANDGVSITACPNYEVYQNQIVTFIVVVTNVEPGSEACVVLQLNSLPNYT